MPELQVDLHDEHGFVGRLDAWYEEAALALEFDGWVKYADPRGGRSPAQVAWEEKRREDRIRNTDVRVVRIVNDDFGPQWSRVVGRIQSAGDAVRRTSPLPHRPPSRTGLHCCLSRTPVGRPGSPWSNLAHVRR